MGLTKLIEILKTKTGKELFGDLGSKHPDYIKYSLVCHPDKNHGSQEANECFKLLQSRATETERKIITISSKKFSYKLWNKPVDSGDISDIFSGADDDDNKVFKVCRSEKHIDLMAKEAQVLQEIAIPDDLHARIKFPTMLDSFVLHTRNRPKKQVSVFDYDPDMISVAKVMQGNKGGIDGENFGWIFSRLLYSLSVLHTSQYAHGAINPNHFMVGKTGHHGMLLGFIHATKFGETVTIRSKNNKEYYPSEIINKQPVSVESDVYMAGMLGVSLLGGKPPYNILPNSVHPEIKSFISAMTITKQNRRPDDAWQLYCDFREILENVFGPPKYATLLGV